ncbi:dihydroxy-acid dehydratase [Enterocloster citroniae]|uniref:dihydroxy-acid dehydratase n=1 Tax=Enterocloster citroniae TaxID=358743 RepID=UPI001D08D0E3|nr:dihydroxy-acid dehydratase [Enterocloster citroniae]MCB7067833.1 dihydroxy-acid dehydratase [Enterocloster citroniae]
MESSEQIFSGQTGAHCRATYKGAGFDPEDILRPHIGIANTFSEFSPGHSTFKYLMEPLKQAIWAAGGIPFEFGVPATCSEVSIGTSCMNMDLAMRDIVAASIEVVASVQHFDGLILTSACDNIVPGTLLAAARLNIPTICMTSGPMMAGTYQGKKIDNGDVTELVFSEVSKGMMDNDTIKEIEMGACPTYGACPLFGTANTMQVLVEALGMTPPTYSTVPAASSDKVVCTRRIGYRIVEMVKENLTPDKIMTRNAIENAIRVDMAIGGSTNAIMHLTALGNELEIDINIGLFDKFSHETPCLVNIKPCGSHRVDELYSLGGLPAIMRQMGDWIHTDCINVTGCQMKDAIDRSPAEPNDVIRSKDDPVTPDGGLVILKGTLSPNGCVIRSSSVLPSMRHFIGKARVFTSDNAAFQAIMDEKIENGDCIVVKNVGPVGAPGMVELMLTADALVGLHMDDHVALVTDGRFSGFNHGPLVGHVSPESALGGPIALVKDGDLIEIDIDNRKLDLKVDEEEMEKRRKEFVMPKVKYKGFMWNYAKHALPPERGAAMQGWMEE